MNRAERHFCGSCLAERPFFGALEGDALSGLGPLTHLLRFTYLKPICGECGTPINWWTQQFLGRDIRSRGVTETEAIARAPSTAKLVKVEELASGERHADFHQQGMELGQLPKPALSESSLDWDEHFATRTGYLRDRDGTLLAKLRTGLNYITGCCIMRGDDAVIVRRAAVATGRSHNWIEIYRQTGWCLRPFGLPKWRPIASISMHPHGSEKSFTPLPGRNAVLALSTHDMAYVDADKPTASMIMSKSDLFGYCRTGVSIMDAYICHEEESVILTYSDWQSLEEPAIGMLALDLEADAKPTNLGIAVGENRILDERGGLLLTASGSLATVHAIGRWRDPLHIECDGAVVEGRFSVEGDQIIFRTRNCDEADQGSAVTMYEIWQLDVHS